MVKNDALSAFAALTSLEAALRAYAYLPKTFGTTTASKLLGVTAPAAHDLAERIPGAVVGRSEDNRRVFDRDIIVAIAWARLITKGRIDLRPLPYQGSDDHGSNVSGLKGHYHPKRKNPETSDEFADCACIEDFVFSEKESSK